MWAIKALRDEPLPLFAAAEIVREAEEPDVLLQPMRAGAEVARDYNRVGLTLRDHPVAFLRDDLRREGILSCRDAIGAKDGKRLTAAGIVLVRQRPGSSRGVVFMTLEDETATLNVIVWADVFEKFRPVVLSASMVAVKGRLQKEGDVIHLIALEIVDRSALLADVGNRTIQDGGNGDVGSICADLPGDRIAVRSRDFH